MSSNQPGALLTVRAALILLIAALVGLATAYLTVLGGDAAPAAALAGCAAAGGAAALFNSLIGKQ